MVMDMEYADDKGTSKFIMNSDENFGGAIWAQNDTEVQLNGGKIINNSAKSGGAIFSLPYTYVRSNDPLVYSKIKYMKTEPTGVDSKYGMHSTSAQIVFKDNVATDGYSFPRWSRLNEIFATVKYTACLCFMIFTGEISYFFVDICF